MSISTGIFAFRQLTGNAGKLRYLLRSTLLTFMAQGVYRKVHIMHFAY